MDTKYTKTAIVTTAACFTSATIAHYAEMWLLAYLIGVVFSIFGALAISSEGNEPL